jgi:hypothetical protein
MSLHHSPRIITENLVLCLDAGNSKSYPGSGTTWTDLSGNGNNGTLVNGVGYNSGNLGSLSFDGTNDYVTTEFRYANNFDFTMCCWMKTSTTQNSSLMGIRSSIDLYTPTFPGWYQSNIYVTGDANSEIVGSNINFNNFSNVSGTPFIDRSVFVGSINVTNGNWKHIVASSNATESKVYIDGTMVGISTNTPTPTRGLANFIIGAAGNYPTSTTLNGFYYNGQISNISFYARELSASEIQQNYNTLKSRYQV